MTDDTTEVAKELRERALEMHAASWSRPDGGQDCTIGAWLCDAAADEIERLAVEIDRLAAALDEMTRRRNAWRDKAAGHDELRAAVRAGIEQAGERNLSRVFLRGALADSEQSLAEARAENARLLAERDAALQAGAEAMRKAAAAACGHGMTGKLFALSIRALPLPGQPKEGEA